MKRISLAIVGMLAVLGSLYVILVPPFQVADEVNHFVRAYQIAHWLPIAREAGQIGARIPLPLAQSTESFAELKFKPQRRTTMRHWRDLWNRYSGVSGSGGTGFLDLSNTVLYSPVPYVPQILAIQVGRLFEARPFALLYLARFGALLVYLAGVALCLWMLRDAPRISLAFGVLFAFPMALSLGASASADGPTIILAALLVALTYRLSVRKSRAEFVAALAVIGALSFCKPIYWPLAIPLAFICLRSGDYRRVLAIAACAFLPLALWTHVVNLRYVKPPVTFDIDPKAQMALLKAHPFRVARMFVVELWRQWPSLRLSWIGLLGWEDCPVPILIRGFWLDSLLLATLLAPRTGPRFALPRPAAMAMFLSVGVSVGLLCLAIFLTWTPAGKLELGIMKGRYFIPMTFGWILFMPGFRVVREKHWFTFAWALVIVCAFLELASLRAVIARYWTV